MTPLAQTLRRGQRLTSSALFRETLDHGHVFGAGCFVLFCRFTGTPGSPRVGFFAGRRLGGAVQRNLAKRRLREAYRRLQGGISQEGVRLVFQARRDAARRPFLEVVDEMERVMRRAGVARRGPPVSPEITHD
jgi:ribonuclease P protein component